MSMRNFWDPQAPGFIEVTQKRRHVSLHIYILPGLTLDQNLKDTIKNHVETASNIWCSQCQVEVYASTIEELKEKNPGDLTIDTEHIRTSDIPKQVVGALRMDNSVYRPGCDDTEIAVYYVKGARFLNAVANSKYNLSTTPRAITFMAEDANGEILAHEIGHILFVRDEPPNSGNFVDSNPDPVGVYKPTDVPFDSGSGHDKRDDHLMNSPTNAGETKISPLQCSIPKRSSKIIKTDNVVIGFDPPPGVLRKCTVRFEKMHVFHVSDELCSDPHLESTWSFKVWHGNIVNGRFVEISHIDRPWIESDLFGPKDFSLTFLGDFIIDITDLNQKIIIDVTGSDEDSCSGDDALPVTEDRYGQAEDWGHGKHEPTHKNDEMMYQLFYSIETVKVNPIRFRNRECMAIVP